MEVFSPTNTKLRIKLVFSSFRLCKWNRVLHWLIKLFHDTLPKKIVNTQLRWRETWKRQNLNTTTILSFYEPGTQV